MSLSQPISLNKSLPLTESKPATKVPSEPLSFADLGLDQALLQAVVAEGYATPSPIQLKAIPAVLANRDVMAAAQTGTGKTAGFTLPMLQRLSKGPKVAPNSIRALVLTPTRELAAQVAESVETYGKFLPLRSTVVFGGVKINPQMMKLRRGVDVLVATPGRLMDLYQQNAVKFSQVEILVLDEADRMLDMGFIKDIKKIIALLPKKRQTLMFSATFNPEIRDLAQKFLHEPIEIAVGQKNSTVQSVEQKVFPVDKSRKTQLLTHLIKQNDWQQVLVFTKTKRGANLLSQNLIASGIQSAAIHGNKSQGARTAALANFKQGKVRVLVATDIAARGLDIEQLPQVVNFELPHVPEDYVHRIGRTGRAGATGEAVSLVSPDEKDLLVAIERLIKKTIPKETITGFEAGQRTPQTKLLPAAKKSIRPNRPRQDNNNSRKENSSEVPKRSHAPKPNYSKRTEENAAPRSNPVATKGNIWKRAMEKFGTDSN